jgi:hypothetical protein
MAGNGGSPGRPGLRPRALAFYLPQFHPIPENDRWWGKGFTEWSNVTRARPLYPGHYQPHLPGELGFYDLRVPEIREAQAELAREHGISGFVYYHYWFEGRRLLERPFDEVLRSGSPDLPFALCWANEPWTRNWDSTGDMLMPQGFSHRNDVAHIRWLLGAFSDDRYIKIDGRPLMLVYRPALLPDKVRMAEVWRTEAQRAGFPDLYLCWVESWGPPAEGPRAHGFDATVGFMPLTRDRIYAPVDSFRSHTIIDYESAFEAELARPDPGWKRFPSAMVSWDNTPRRSRHATIFEGATPSAYERWLRRTAEKVSGVRAEENYLFLVAWNEWAEGNHLEPDQRYGRGFLEATRAVLGPEPARASALSGARGSDTTTPRHGPPPDDSRIVNACCLLRGLDLDSGTAVADLAPPGAAVATAVTGAGLRYRGLGPAGAGGAKGADQGAIQVPRLDGGGLPGQLEGGLDEIGDVGAILLLDSLQHLEQPQELLSALSSWAMKHGEPKLVVSVPNIAHLDVALRLLAGEWHPGRCPPDAPAPLRCFTDASLERLLTRCGWHLVAREDACCVRPDALSPSLHEDLPEEMIGAIRILSDSYNPSASVEHFVWALAPHPVDDPPASFEEAVRKVPGDAPEIRPARQAHREGAGTSSDPAGAVRDYLVSVGLVVSETNRRASMYAGRPPAPVLPRWKRAVLRLAYSSPRSAAIFKRVYGRLR